MKAMYFFMWGKGVKVIGQCKVCEDIVRTKFDWGPQRGGGQLDANFYSSEFGFTMRLRVFTVNCFRL